MAGATFSCVTLALLLANPVTVAALFRPRFSPAFPLIATTGIFMIWTVLCAATSNIPALSLAQTASYLLPIVTMLSVLTIRGTPNVQLALCAGVYIIISLLACLTVLSSVLSGFTPWLSSIGRTQWPFDDANHLAMIMNAGIFMSLAHFRLHPKNYVRLMPGLICLIALLTTGSRGGIVGLVAGATLLTCLSRPRLSRSTVLIGAGGIVLTLTIVAFATPAGLMALSGFGTLIIDPRDALGSRPDIWAATIHLALQRPLFGFGTGTFAAVYPQVVEPTHLTSGYAAHNDLLQIMLETGIVGGILYLAIIGLTLQLVFRNKNNLSVQGAATVFTALIIQAQIEFMLGVLPVLFLTGLTLGMIVTQSSAPLPTVATNRPVYWAGQLILLAILLVTMMTNLQLYAQRELQKSDMALQSGDVKEFARHLQSARAFSFDLQAGPYARAAGYRLMLLMASISGVESSGPVDIQTQIDAALVRNPYLPIAYEIQGRLDEASGKNPLPAWGKGLAVEPRSASLRLAILRYHEHLGHHKEIDDLAADTRRWIVPALKGPVKELIDALEPYKTP